MDEKHAENVCKAYKENPYVDTNVGAALAARLTQKGLEAKKIGGKINQDDPSMYTRIMNQKEYADVLQSTDPAVQESLIYFTIGGNHGREGLQRAIEECPPPNPVGQILLERGLMCRVYYGLADDEVCPLSENQHRTPPKIMQ